MKRHRKKIIAIFAACMFAMMMMLNVNTTVNGTNFSVEGYTALVSGSTGGGCSGGNWDVCCAIWTITINYPSGNTSCTTGGDYNCSQNC